MIRRYIGGRNNFIYCPNAISRIVKEHYEYTYCVYSVAPFILLFYTLRVHPLKPFTIIQPNRVTPYIMLFVGSSALVVLLTLMLFLSATGQEFSSAPDDADPFCTHLPGRKEYAAGEKVLLDTQNYQSSALLDELGEDRTWLNLGPDGITSGKVNKIDL